MGHLQCELIAEVGSRERFAELAEGWLTGVLREVFPELDGALAAGPVLYKRDLRDASSDIPWGEPGTVWAQLHLNKGPEPIGGRRVQYTRRAWQRFLQGLAEHPFTASVDILPLDDQGLPVRPMNVFITVQRLPGAPEWVRFSFSTGESAIRAAGAVGRWVAFGKKWAEAVRSPSGIIGEGPGHCTALEYAIGGIRLEETIPRAREVLRGYSWVTVVAGELAQRLGGPRALAASGAFYEVTELDYGSVWLQAAPDPSGYQGEAVRRVFEALAPVLITGVANESPGARPPLVYGVDAADFR